MHRLLDIFNYRLQVVPYRYVFASLKIKYERSFPLVSSRSKFTLILTSPVFGLLIIVAKSTIELPQCHLLALIVDELRNMFCNAKKVNVNEKM